MSDYELFLKKSIRIGIITLGLAVIANFMPVFYLWLAYGAIPPLADIWKLLILCASVQGISWIIQPVSYFPILGTIGSYITWLAGAAADIRTPASAMAQKAAGVEAGTPEGTVISTIGIATSVFVSVLIVTLFTFTGSVILPMLPKFVTGSFTFILPAIFAALIVGFAQKDIDYALAIAAFGCSMAFFQKYVYPIPNWLLTLMCIVVGMYFGHLKYKWVNRNSSKAKAV